MHTWSVVARNRDSPSLGQDEDHTAGREDEDIPKMGYKQAEE